MPGFLDRLDRILQQVHEDLVKLARGAVNGLDLAEFLSVVIRSPN
jgi:hypothetical protein